MNIVKYYKRTSKGVEVKHCKVGQGGPDYRFNSKRLPFVADMDRRMIAAGYTRTKLV